MKYSWNMLFQDFRKNYPEKWKKGTSFTPNNHMSIVIYIPDDGKYLYDYFDKKLTLLEKYLTKSQSKYLRIFEREEKVREISNIMRERKISQKKLSMMSGVSRQSINYYLTGNKTPKLSTLEKLCNALEQKDI